MRLRAGVSRKCLLNRKFNINCVILFYLCLIYLALLKLQCSAYDVLVRMAFVGEGF